MRVMSLLRARPACQGIWGPFPGEAGAVCLVGWGAPRLSPRGAESLCQGGRGWPGLLLPEPVRLCFPSCDPFRSSRETAACK